MAWRPRVDVAIAALAFLVVSAVTWGATRTIDPRLLTLETVDVWFEADIARVVENVSDRWSNHYRAKVHPIFALLVLPVVYLLKAVLSVDAWTAIRMVLTIAAGLWTIGLYAVLRLIGCGRTDSGIFTLLGVTSAGAMFWFVVPETHTVASITILLALLVVALSASRRIPALVEVAVGAATLGVTLTNWMAGILASWSHRSWRQTLQISVNAFALTVVLWAVNKKLAPSSPFFLGNPTEDGAVLAPEALGPLKVATSFFMHTVVMPAIAVIDRPGAGQWPIMVVQSSAPGSASVVGVISALLWAALLVIGVWSLVRVKEQRAMRIFLATFLAGQLAVYLVYGNETFLYAPNFLPALIVLAALGALSPMRRVVGPIAALLVVGNVLNNGQQWTRANHFLSEYEQLRHDPAAERAERPDGPWPEPGAFERLEMPGVRNFDVGYVSSGGSFSPGLDQFTISVWVRDEQGALLANSDEFPPVSPDSAEPFPNGLEPGALFRTPHYDVRWAPDGPRKYRMRLTTKGDFQVSLVVRSVGARAAPIRHLSWNGDDLVINNRWVIEQDSASIDAFLVDENAPGWQNARPAESDISVLDGWAAARLDLAVPGSHTLVVRDLAPEASIDRPLGVIPDPGSMGSLSTRRQ
jgi:hypothetical protein